MTRRKRGSKQFVVLGLGRFGSSVARTLAEMGYEVLGIDQSEARVERISGVATHAAQADTTDESALKALGVRNFDVAIVGIGDLQASIMTTVILKDLGVRYVVAKAVSQLHGKVLERIGADRVVYPEREMGTRVAHNLVSGNLVDFLELAPGVSIIEVVAKPEYVGKSLQELNFRARFGINILSIRRGDSVNLGPSAHDAIQADDILVAMGYDRSLENLEAEEDSR